MYDIHIEEFYRDCAKILMQLYLNFPKKSAVFVEDIAGPDTPDEYGIHSDRFQSCFGAMLWLENEGYLAYEALIRQEALDQSCLSALGLRMLNTSANNQNLHELLELISPRLSRHTTQPNIEIIRHIFKHGTSTQLSSAMIFLLEHFRLNR